MKLTRQDPLEVFLAFGSVSGRFGGHGQTDYSLASDMLAKLIQRFRVERPDCASIVFHWPAWDEIGMAMRAESRQRWSWPDNDSCRRRRDWSIFLPN